MSEPAKVHSNQFTVGFIIILCVVCGTLLGTLATGLQETQEHAQDLDRSKQLLIAARIYHPKGYFQLRDAQNQYVAAKYDMGSKLLTEGAVTDRATMAQIAALSQARVRPLLVDSQGQTRTFEDAKINMIEYLAANKKGGFANLPQKLIYAVYPQQQDKEKKMEPEAYIIPVNGRGLWDGIYGYLAIEKDGNHVIGTSWYKHAETPGLGANIVEESWQRQFLGKTIFQSDNSGKTDFATAPLGIRVVKGTVKEVYGDNPKGQAAVDGIAGSTLTGNGVTAAYKDSLGPYRPFLLKLHAAHGGK